MKELTKYEFARVIGARALQLSLGAPPVIKFEDVSDPILVANKEFEEEVIPLSILKKS